ncbi:hypothetical protein ACYJ1Y_11455 [Natrialbaceae archaeon A-gly3]
MGLHVHESEPDADHDDESDRLSEEESDDTETLEEIIETYARS